MTHTLPIDKECLGWITMSEVFYIYSTLHTNSVAELARNWDILAGAS